MHDVTVTETIAAPLSEVWESWDDFGAIGRFNPNLRGAHLINDSAPRGLGAERQCDLADGKNYIRERVIAHEPERRLVIDIYEGTLPIEQTVATFLFTPKGPEATEVSMTISFAPKPGVIGMLMVPLLKPQLRKMMRKLLAGNAAFVEKGIEVHAMA